MIIGITGNTGSGKSEVSDIMAKKLGAFIINADHYGHVLLESDTEIANQIAMQISESVIAEDGSVIRSKLAEIVFSNPESLTKLNRITQGKMTRGIYDQIINGQKIYNNIIVDCALIYEWNILSFFDKIITVTANPDVRLDRLMTYRKILEETAVKQMTSQMDDAFKIERADIVIVNEGSKNELITRINEIISELEL